MLPYSLHSWVEARLVIRFLYCFSIYLFILYHIYHSHCNILSFFNRMFNAFFIKTIITDFFVFVSNKAAFVDSRSDASCFGPFSRCAAGCETGALRALSRDSSVLCNIPFRVLVCLCQS